MNPARVLIVGAGIAGSRCAETLRALGHEGEIVLVGDEAYPPYERPALSKQLLDGSRTSVALRGEGFWRERRIDLRVGTRVLDLGLGTRVARTSDVTVPWDALVLATGARPRVVPALAPRDGVHLLRTRADAESLRAALVPGARLAVVGAGFVGAEVASTAARLGARVTLLEAGAVPFERVLGPQVGRLLADRYRAHGVDLRVGAPVERLLAGTGGEPHALELADRTTIVCDLVLAAVGSVPAAELVADGAVATDPHGRTELPGVHACGDVAAWWRPSLRRHVRSEHWTAAAAQAATVARTILGGGDPARRARLLLVRPVRPATPARRRRGALGARDARGHSGLILRLVPGRRRPPRRRARRQRAAARRGAASRDCERARGLEGCCPQYPSRV